MVFTTHDNTAPGGDAEPPPERTVAYDAYGGGMAGAQAHQQRPAFRPGVAEQLGFYVYLLIDPRSRKPFYVGKGTGNRCFQHLVVARTSKRDHTREFAKLDTIRQIESVGRQVRIEILRHGLDESTAFEVEAAAIDLVVDGTNVMGGRYGEKRGRMSLVDVNALHGAEPVVIAPEHRVILIRVSRAYRRGMTDRDLYEITRGFWKFARRWSDPAHERSPQYAFAVYGGVVRAVYRIHHWYQPEGDEVVADPTRQGRWGFRGKRDPALETRYVGRNVAVYLTAAAQNPIGFVNCATKWKGPT